MDSTLKQMLDGFWFSIRNYKQSLGPKNAKIIAAEEMMNKLTAKAEGGADMAAISMDPDFGNVAGLLGELASEPPLPPEELDNMVQSGELSADGEVPDASVPAAGYHMAFDALPPDSKEEQRKYYERIFQLEAQAENAIHFNAMLMEDTVLLDMTREPLKEIAVKAIEQAKETYSPTVDFQQNLAIQTYERVQTVAELEFEGTKMAELSNAEHVWDALYLEVIGLLPACAQAIEAFGPNKERVEKLQRSHRFMADFMGITWGDVFADGRYVHFWNNVLWPKVPAAKKLARGVNTAEGWRDMLKNKFYDPFVKEQPVQSDPERARVRFWRTEYYSRHTMQLLNNPPRPEIVKT